MVNTNIIRQIPFGIIIVSSTILLFMIGCDSKSPTESNTISLTKISGDIQSGVPGDTLSTPLIVLVTDNKGRAISGQWLEVRVIAGDASLSDTLVVTNEIGKAETKLILGDSEGEISVEIKLKNTNIKTIFTASANNLPPASINIVSGNNQSGNPGQQLPIDFQVKVVNKRDLPVEGVVVTFNISEGTGILSALSDTTNSIGIAKTTLILGNTTGTIKVTASIQEADYLAPVIFTSIALNLGLIAFSSVRDGNYEIYIMSANGSNQTRLTNNSNHDLAPKWSPDGNKIAFYSDIDGNYEIYIMNSDGTNQSNLTNNLAPDSSPSWSPDGSMIAFTSNRDVNQEIYVMNKDGSNQNNLTNNLASDSSPSWSPDGAKIAFSSYRDGNYDIYIMNTDGSNQTRLLTNGYNPSWSPNGAKIAFTSYRDGNNEIYIMDANGSNQIRLTNNSASDNYPSWSPDGAKIAFSYNRDGDNQEIYVMDADGSNQTRLTNNSNDDFYPSWTQF